MIRNAAARENASTMSRDSRRSVPASMSNLNASKTLRGYAPKDAATKAYHDFTREYLSKGGAVNG